MVELSNEIKRKVSQRDNYTCQACDQPTKGQVHHIKPRRLGGTDDLENLTLLCGRCHMLISVVPKFAIQRAWHIPLDEIDDERTRVIEALRYKGLYFENNQSDSVL